MKIRTNALSPLFKGFNFQRAFHFFCDTRHFFSDLKSTHGYTVSKGNKQAQPCGTTANWAAKSLKGSTKKDSEMKRSTYNPLIGLIQTLDDGIEFYKIAGQKTDSHHLKDVFAKTADIREFALAYILPYVEQHSLDFDKALTYHGTLANRYAPLLEQIVCDEQLTLVQQVEEHLVDAMVTASMNIHNALVQSVLKDLVPRISQNFEALSEALNKEEQIAA